MRDKLDGGRPGMLAFQRLLTSDSKRTSSVLDAGCAYCALEFACPVMLRTALGVSSRHLLGKGLQMRIEYEIACKQAGLPEEKIREIRQLFDADYKMLKRQNEVIQREGISFQSLELLQDPEGDSAPYYIMDPESDVERIVLHRLDLEKLYKVLNRIPERDKEFILDCFDPEWGARKKIAKKYGMTIGAADQKKRRILEKLKKLFFEDGTNPISFK